MRFIDNFHVRTKRKIKGIIDKVTHLSAYSRSLRRELEDSQSTKDHQLSEFRRLLTYAGRNCPYYQKLFETTKVVPEKISSYEEIARIPTLQKSALKHRIDSLLSSEYKKENLQPRSTSGATGTPLKLYNTDLDNMYWEVARERVRGLHGIHYYSHRVLNLISYDDRARYGSFRYILSRLGLGLECSINVLKPIQAQVELAGRLRPHAIWGHPSAIRRLGEELVKQNTVDIRPRVIFTVAEVYDDETRRVIKECFGVKIIDYYGSVETGPIAWQMAEEGPYYVNNDTVLVEVVGDDGMPVSDSRVGRVIVTNLYSYAMPIIRYELGDIVELVEPPGRSLISGPMLKRINGRQDDYIILTTGERHEPRRIRLPLQELGDEIEQFKVEQDRIGHVIVKVKPARPDDHTRLRERVVNAYADRFGKLLTTDVVVVDEIPFDQSGKRRSVVCHIRQDPQK